MELVLVRHAQPAWANPEGRSTNDPGLTPLGQRQAARLAEWLSVDDSQQRSAITWGTPPETEGFDALSTSPARRARETAEPVEDALRMSAAIRPWMLEQGMPDDWEGTSEEEVIKTLAAMRLRPRSEWWDGAPGGETFRDFHQRVTQGLNGFLAEHGAREHPGDPDNLWDVDGESPRLLLFAHAGTNSVITSHLLGLDPQPWEWERFPCDHASITVLRSRPIADGAIWALKYFSDVAHLPVTDVTA